MRGLTATQVRQFWDDGYVSVDGLLDPKSDLDPVIHEYEAVLDRLAGELHAAGAVQAQYFDFSLPTAPTPDTPMWVGPAVFWALRNEHILDAVESLIGGEIYSNTVQHVRIKPPESLCPKDANGNPQLAATPWHQ